MYSEAEHFFTRGMALEIIQENRWLAGDYEHELGPLSNAMREIEKAHGLNEDESWLVGDAPAEHQKLNTRYSNVLDQKQVEVFREFEEYHVADLFLNSPDQFDVMREAGRVAFHGRDNEEAHLQEIIERCEREAGAAENVNASYAASILHGAALEAQLLLKCLRAPSEAERARAKFPASKGLRRDVRSWSFEHLINMCLSTH